VLRRAVELGVNHIAARLRAGRPHPPPVPPLPRRRRTPGRPSPARRASQGALVAPPAAASGRLPCPRAAAGRGCLSCSRIYPVKG
jgi:hypothetical protein